MERKCDACDTPYEARRPSSRFCSDLCRKRASRNPSLTEAGEGEAPPTCRPWATGAVETLTRQRIEALEVVDLPQSAIALALAVRLDSPRETGSAVAVLAKQLDAMLDGLERRGKRAADALDELRERRRVKSSA